MTCPPRAGWPRVRWHGGWPLRLLRPGRRLRAVPRPAPPRPPRRGPLGSATWWACAWHAPSRARPVPSPPARVAAGVAVLLRPARGGLAGMREAAGLAAGCPPVNGCWWGRAGDFYTRAVRYAILGPLEVSDGDRVVAVGGRKERILLAVLLACRGSVVPV